MTPKTQFFLWNGVDRIIHDKKNEPSAPKAIALFIGLTFVLNVFAAHAAGVINLF